MCASEGGRSGMVRSIRRPGVPDQLPRSAAPGVIRPRRRTGAGAGLHTLEGERVGGGAACPGAEPGRAGGQGMARTRASGCSTQVRDLAHRRTADVARALPVFLRRAPACTTAEDSTGRRCDHEGPHASCRGDTGARGVSPRRRSGLCARANDGIQAPDRAVDRAVLGGDSVGRGRCAA